MRKGITVVRTHMVLSLCLMMGALAMTGGGVYAVLAGNTDSDKSADGLLAPTNTGPGVPPKSGISQITQQWCKDIAAENNIPLPETALTQAMISQPADSISGIEWNPVIAENTPAVIPVHLPALAVSVQQLATTFPGLMVTAQAQAQLDEQSNVTMGIATTPVNQGSLDTDSDLGKSLSVQKSTGEGEGELDISGLNLAADADQFLSIASPGSDPLTFDTNAYGITPDGNVAFCEGNGIPDRAELMLVQHVLQSGSLELPPDGASHSAAVMRWQEIMAAFHQEGSPPTGFTADQCGSFKRLTTGLCMLGDPASVQLGLALGAIVGWVPVDDTAQRSLCVPMPWPFSAQGNFNGSFSLTPYCNSAKWVIAREKASAAISPASPTFDEVFSAYRDMLTVQLDASKSDAQTTTTVFYNLHTEMVGEFVSLSPCPVQYAAGSQVRRTAVADYPWQFDHWEITPEDGTTSVETNHTVTVVMNGTVTIRAVAIHVPTAEVGSTFTDPRLEQALRVAAKKLNGELLWGDVQDLQVLAAAGLGITSIDGLDNLRALTYLDLSNNLITDITPLGTLSTLESLLLGGNQIVDITPLMGLSNLELLSLGWGLDAFLNLNEWTSPGAANSVQSIEALSNLRKLVIVDLNGNDIDDCSVFGSSSFPEMRWLTLDGNPLSDIGPIGALDNLVVLSIQNADITDASLGELIINSGSMPATCRMPDLMGVALGGNQELMTLDALELCTHLQAVLCGNNPGLGDIGALAGKAELNIVLLANTAVTDLSPLSGGAFENGWLTLRNNPPLLEATPIPACEQVAAVEHPVPGIANTVDRDFACGTETLLTIAVLPDEMDAGNVSPFVGARPYAAGSLVALEATQTNPAYIFSHWTGDVTSSDTRITVTMGIDKNISAVFVKDGFQTLTMLPPDGPGTVSPAPGQWACRLNEQRTITAVPSPGWAFEKWEWSDSNDPARKGKLKDAICLLSPMSRDLTVKAVFKAAKWRLRISRLGTGTTEPDVGFYYFLDGDVVPLSASPDSGGCFTGWFGAPVAFPMAADTTITMNMDQNLWSSFGSCDAATILTIAAPAGQGESTPPAGTYQYAQNAQVSLSANPLPGWRFDHWEEGSANVSCAVPFTVSLTYQNPAHVVTPVFVQHMILDDLQTWLTETTLPAAAPAIGSYFLGGSTHEVGAGGNDMPDIARFAMLHLCMYGAEGPLTQAATDAYWKNVVAWYAWVNSIPVASLPNGVFPSAAQIHTYAAYCTLSTDIQNLAVAHFKGRCSAVTSQPDGLESVTGFGLDADFDGDGFTNLDEWLYADSMTLYSLGDMEDITGTNAFGALLTLYFTAGQPVSAGAVPDFPTVAAGPVPDMVDITVAKQGGGSVYPAPGVYHLPVCRLSNWWMRDAQGALVQNPNGTCVPTAFSAQAESTELFAFQRWESMIGSGASAQAGSSHNATINVPLVAGQPCTATAVFTPSAGMGKHGMVQALRQFLVWRGLLVGTADVYASTFDSGGAQDSTNPNVFAGNGIPDVAEFALLDKVLFDTTYPADKLAPNPGVSQTYALLAFQKNRGLAAAGLAGTPAAPDWLVDVVAGYMTLGLYDYERMIRYQIWKGLGREILADGFDNSQARYLAARSDADGDGRWNTDEWKHVAKDTVTPVVIERPDAFVDWALHKDPSRTPSPLSPRVIRDTSGLPACWNDSLNPAGGYISKQSVGSGGLDFRVLVKLDPNDADDDENTREIAGDSLAQVRIPVGRFIQLDAVVPQQNDLYMWDIPGTLADGSNEKKVQFQFDPGNDGDKSGNDPTLSITAIEWPRTYFIAIPEPPAGSSSAYSVSLRGKRGDLGLRELGIITHPFYPWISYREHSVPFGATIVISSSEGFPYLHDGSALGPKKYSRSSTASVVAPMAGMDYVGSTSAAVCSDSDNDPTTDDSIETTLDSQQYAITWVGAGYGTVFDGSALGCKPLDITEALVCVFPEIGYYFAGWEDSSENKSNGDKCTFPVRQVSGAETTASLPKSLIEESYTLDVELKTEELSDTTSAQPTGDKAASCGTVIVTPAAKFYDGTCEVTEGTVVQVKAIANCPYAFRRWEGTGLVWVSAKWDTQHSKWVPTSKKIRLDDVSPKPPREDPWYWGPVIEKTIYLCVDKDERHKAIKAYFSDEGLCGQDGLKGLNIKKSTLAGMMSDEIKAKAYVENGWRQFTCGRLPWHNFGSHAVGLMQLIPPKAGYTDQELQWDEKQNLKCGTEYHDSLKKRAADKMKNAPSGDPPDMGDPPVPTSRADAELLEAIAKYMCPRDGYWAPFDKDNPQWVRNSGGQSGYADKVLSVMKHQVWDNDFVYKASGKDPETLKALPECPCSCGGQ